MNPRAFSKSPLFLSVVLFCWGADLEEWSVKKNKQTARALNRCLFFFFFPDICQCWYAKTLFNSSFRSHKSSVVEHALPPLFPNTGRGGTDYSAPRWDRHRDAHEEYWLTTVLFDMLQNDGLAERGDKKAQKNKTVKRWNPSKYRESLENLSKRKLQWRAYEKTKPRALAAIIPALRRHNVDRDYCF